VSAVAIDGKNVFVAYQQMSARLLAPVCGVVVFRMEESRLMEIDGFAIPTAAVGLLAANGVLYVTSPDGGVMAVSGFAEWEAYIPFGER
jgi:hypothetical protein